MKQNTKKLIAFFGIAMIVTVVGTEAIGVATIETTFGTVQSILSMLTTTDMSATVDFPDYVAGSTAYSLNNLTVCNPGSIPTKYYISGTDMFVTGGSCPVTNTIEVSTVEYKFDGLWHDMPEYNINGECTGGWTCRGGEFLDTFGDSECREIPFRFVVPSPCTGTITTPMTIHITNM